MVNAANYDLQDLYFRKVQFLATLMTSLVIISMQDLNPINKEHTPELLRILAKDVILSWLHEDPAASETRYRLLQVDVDNHFWNTL